ncbi:hypothetical protein BpHYR1_023022, partial [Brachionus plicatilis]
MGQEQSRESKFSTLQLKKYDDVISIDMVQIEKKMIMLDECISNTRSKLEEDFRQYEENLSQYLLSPSLIKSRILLKKSELTSSINRSIKKLYFMENFKSLNEILSENFYYMTKNLNFYKKIKYFEFINFCEELKANHLDEKCYNYIILPISRYKIFYCCANFYKKSCIKIVNRHGLELHRRAINPNFYFSNFVVYGRSIAGIYSDIRTNKTLIEIYNDELELEASKLFDHKLELIYLNSEELVCKSKEKLNLYFFLNLKLEQVFSFDVKGKNESIQLHDGDIEILGLNYLEIHILVKSKKLLKRIDRKTGKSTGSIDLIKRFDEQENEINFSYLQMDLDQSIFLVKDNIQQL